ncbi:hypothetical protein L917_14040 [Phytophthora nicotianae]|uniref:Uncharacterized protein n=1 Tax=Phytophthora nicotianae TaxID=4792 RepID=W2KPJ8_PHYNI|nr:hypothetical protein L917_14040 [Phytophthora nicotianae]
MMKPVQLEALKRLWVQHSRSTGVASKGKSIHTIAVILSTGLAYQESQFGSFTADWACEFIQHFLCRIRCTTSRLTS